MEGIEGKAYGPYPLRVCAEKVAEFVAATLDDPDRWAGSAPPGWAAVALFVVAPRLLTDPDLGDAGKSVIHGEQRFSWSRNIPIETELEVSGVVSKVRERGGVFFTSFEFEARDQAGPVVNGSSTFLMSGSSPPASVSEPVDLPSPAARGSNDSVPRSATDFPGLRRSASRSDLVRYAAATRDWNPIHWDHDSAVAAGLPTIVVHGLLQAAWLLSAGSVMSQQAAPVADARFRFRSPMVAGSEGAITGDVQGSEASARLAIGDREIVSATMTLR
jgi:acyl dehydratase